MADYDLLYQDTYIDALLATANELKTAGYIYKGVATPSTNPGTPTERVAYLASEPGTYTNFGGIVLTAGLYVLTYDTTWAATTLNTMEVMQTTGQSTTAVMSQKAVSDILTEQVSGRYNADDINKDYEAGIINHSTGGINTGYPAWRTSKFLEIPSDATYLSVFGVFPLKTSLNAVGCYLYDANKQPIAYPSNIPTATAAASFIITLSNYPTAKYVRITQYQSNGTTGDNCYISPVLLDVNTVKSVENRVNIFSNILSEYIPFDRVKEYIQTDGVVKNTGSDTAGATAYVPVQAGDILYFTNLGWLSTTLNQCWGYDANLTPYVMLVGGYDVRYVPFNGQVVVPSGVAYIKAAGALSYSPTLKVIHASESIYTKYNYITITQNGTNYNLIRSAMAAITDASPSNQYIIIIPNGNYFECDIKGKKYVTLHGESKENTIIYCDGTSSNVTPSDYTVSADANKALSSIDKSNKHIVNLQDDIIIENCTLQSNDVKYCIHCESSTWAKATVRDCIFIGTNNHSAIGMGLRGKQNIEFIRCKISVTGCTNAAYAHNWDYLKTTDLGIPIRGGGVFVKFSGCKFSNASQYLFTVGEIGSFNDDKVVFENCKTDNPTIRVLVETTGNRTYHIKEDGSYETNPLLVPYDMHLDMINCGVENTIQFTNSNRPNFENYCMIIN